ncbi:hypothetical protein BRARA_A01802 [Brassica rapa]|uniref:DUF1421 domain-containing protein n=1 Tax=Brassica campestris TaxID=3711 RepID=A0A398AQ77_BRACM|nr:hypothetical protein BRARA_A01802 [Brassica rapa]
MASDRVNSGSKGFDFGSDDILCSYDDFANQEDSSNGPNSDPAIAANKEFHKTRMARSSVFPTSSYTPPDDSLSQDIINATVERTMKKYSDNVMRFLEGISSRLSQLELYCYNLDKTIGEMRSELTRDNEEADAKLRSMDKHLQEVHRSVQILRDKQELFDTQKELARLQLVQKDSSSSSHGEERVATPVPEPKKIENTSDAHNKQLALALPHQIATQPQQQHQQQYYMPPTSQLQNTPAPAPVPAPPAQQHQAGGGNSGTPPPPVSRSKYGELIEKLVSMGFRGDHVMAVIQRMEESGQAIDFNALLDRLSAQSSGGPPRGW